MKHVKRLKSMYKDFDFMLYSLSSLFTYVLITFVFNGYLLPTIELWVSLWIGKMYVLHFNFPLSHIHSLLMVMLQIIVNV